jgi:CheY-like chemotaxis protein
MMSYNRDGQHPPYIIVADDTEVVRLTVSYLIHRFYPGATLTAVSNGLEAMMSHVHRPAALILTDYWMPVMNGIDLLQTLRNQGDMTPCVVMSGDKTVVAQVTPFQATRFIYKPFSVRQLEEVALSLLPPSYRRITWTVPDRSSRH